MRIARRAFLVFFCVVFIALVHIQILDHPHYIRKGKLQGYESVETPVPRGKIFDRNGRVLAMSVPAYGLYLDFWMIRHHEKKNPGYFGEMKKFLRETLNIPEKDLAEYATRPYPLIRRELTLDEYNKLKASGMPGFVFCRTYRRVYPGKSLACHVLGFTGVDGEGLEGVELFYDGLLRGKPGLSLMPRDGEGRFIPSLEKKLSSPEPGRDIYLTIDYSVQAIVEEEVDKVLAEFSPANVTVVVMNPADGAILALVNKPDYDPNLAGKCAPALRRNKAITDFFEPGSIFKIVTATACLEKKLITPQDMIFCESGKFYVRNHWLHDAHPYGSLSCEDVIVKSSNIGTVKMAMKLGEEELYRNCRTFGFGEVTGIDLPGEIPGVLRPVSSWSGYSITAVPIGQEVGINSMQGIRAMSVFSSGGILVKPHVLKEIRGRDGTVTPYAAENSLRVVSEETCNVMNGILEKVVSPYGTAPRAHIPGYHIYGKTGTAQKIVGGHYSSSKYVGSFLGYLISDRARFAMSVNVDEPKCLFYGGLVAAPAFRNIMWRMIQYWNIPPDQTLKEAQSEAAVRKQTETKGGHETERSVKRSRRKKGR